MTTEKVYSTDLTGNLPFENKAIEHDVPDSVTDGDGELREDE